MTALPLLSLLAIGLRTLSGIRHIVVRRKQSDVLLLVRQQCWFLFILMEHFPQSCKGALYASNYTGNIFYVNTIFLPNRPEQDRIILWLFFRNMRAIIRDE